MKNRFKDLTNLKFGKLTAIKIVGEDKNNRKLWLCKCDCGNEKIVSSKCLLGGNTKSCGCYRKEIVKLLSKKRKTLTEYEKSLKIIFSGMKSRCYNKNNKSYKYYGERNIKICNEWLEDFNSFYKWSINNGWQKGLSIDRINVNGNYEPNNCRWVDIKTQSRNKRNNIIIKYNGEIHNLPDWIEILKKYRIN